MPLSTDLGEAVGAMTYLQGQFYAHSLMPRLWRSRDGERWDRSPIDALQTNGIAFGNDRFVATDNGPFEVSTDGVAFHSVSLDCAMTGACLADPSLMVHQGPKRSIVFAGGAFFAETSFSALVT